MSSSQQGHREGRSQAQVGPEPDRASRANDLDIIAATYGADAPYGSPVYLVHFDSRSPDGTITSTGTAGRARASASTRS